MAGFPRLHVRYCYYVFKIQLQGYAHQCSINEVSINWVRIVSACFCYAFWYEPLETLQFALLMVEWTAMMMQVHYLDV